LSADQEYSEKDAQQDTPFPGNPHYEEASENGAAAFEPIAEWCAER